MEVRAEESGRQGAPRFLATTRRTPVAQLRLTHSCDWGLATTEAQGPAGPPQVLEHLEHLERQLRGEHFRSQQAAAAAAVGSFMLLDDCGGELHGGANGAGAAGGLVKTVRVELPRAHMPPPPRQQHA